MPPAWPSGSDSSATPFNPAAYPGLSPEACAFFNTPVEDCDPDELRLVLAAFVAQIADSLPPELGMDAKALLATFCARLGTESAAARPDLPPAEQSPPPPTTPQDADAAPEGQIQKPGSEPADAAALTEGAAQDAGQHAASSSVCVPPDRFPSDRGRWFRHCRHRRHCHHRRASVQSRGAYRRRGSREATPSLPPRRLFYAACAGPP